MAKTLRDEMPAEALRYYDQPFLRFLDIEVTQAFGGLGEELHRWPGKHKNVVCWWQLANGYAVGWNENPSRGWSFPVLKSAVAPQADRLAAEFAAVLKTWATPEEWATMRRENAGREYQGEGAPCASHNFCDANMAMLEAAQTLGLPAITDHEDGTPEGDEACALWNAAWGLAKAKYLTAAPFEVEFPDFDAKDMPEIPAGFDDVSWHNDSCPSFMNEAAGLILFVEHIDPAQRDFEEMDRFNLAVWDNGADASIVSGNDYEAVLAAIAAHPAIGLPAVAPSSYGVHYAGGGYRVVWCDENGLCDKVDLGGSAEVEPYHIFPTVEAAQAMVERISPAKAST